jgi:hypothetical protein
MPAQALARRHCRDRVTAGGHLRLSNAQPILSSLKILLTKIGSGWFARCQSHVSSGSLVVRRMLICAFPPHYGMRRISVARSRILQASRFPCELQPIQSPVARSCPIARPCLAGC